MKPTIKLMLQAFVAIILLSTAVLPAYAQSERERERAENDRDLEERAFRLRMLEKSHNQPAKRRDPKLAFAQLQDDFVHIQLLNRRLVQAVAHGGALDLKF